jgi:hypothetical protein
MKTRSAYNPNPNTKAYYMLNGSSIDISGSNNSGTDTSITYPQGRFGQAAKFDGSSSFINGGTSTTLKPTTQVTSIVWFNNSMTGIAGYILTAKWDVNIGGSVPYGFYLNNVSTNTLMFRIKYGTGPTYSDISVSSLNINDNRWHCAIGTYDSGSQILYLDGRRIGSATAGSSLFSDTNGEFLIGSGTNGPVGQDAKYSGLIDEVIIESRAWTPAEVSTYYRKSMLNYRQRSYAQALKTFLIEETLALVESATTLRARAFTVAENLGLVETWTALKGISFTVAETLGLVEATSWVHNKVFSIAESLGIIELSATISKKWSNITKSVSSWTNSSKNDSDWTNLPKN